MSPKGSRIAIGTGVLVLVIVVVLAVVIGRLDRIVKHAVETVGPQITGTPVSLGSVKIAAFSGDGELQALQVGNPDGFSTPYAFDLSRISLSIDPASLGSDVVQIRRIAIDGPKLIAEFDEKGRVNLRTIQDNARGAARKARSPAPEESGGGTRTKMVIGEFRLENVELRAVSEAFQLDKTLTMKPIVLQGLGVRQNGATAAEIGQEVLRSVATAAVNAARKDYLMSRRAALEAKAKEKGIEFSEDLLRPPPVDGLKQH